jgi:hypothetical protein
MSASLEPDVQAPADDPDGYLHKLVDFLHTQSVGQGLTYDDVAGTSRREELGISSLDIILVVSNYLNAHAGGKIAFQPEWVFKLDDVDGIVSVLREIDQAAGGKAPA